jgi:prevent-host-death family protein
VELTMRTYSVTEADSHFKEVLDRVRLGETVLVTENGRALAEIGPANVEAGAKIDLATKLEEVRRLFKGVTLQDMMSARHEGHKY